MGFKSVMRVATHRRGDSLTFIRVGVPFRRQAEALLDPSGTPIYYEF
jgi:hypothetical protein